MAPRAYWKGYLRLSLVTCPIALYPASTSAEKTHFHQINKNNGHRLRQKLVDEVTGREVDKENRARGYELTKGKYVEIEEDELDAVKLESTHTIEIDEFVPADEIDLRYYDKPYYLIPNAKTGADAFVVIRDAMKRKDKVALGRVVLASREHVIALRPLDRGLLGTTLRYPYELRDEDDYFDNIPSPRVSKDMIDLASHILDTKAAKFDPKTFKDKYENALKALVKRKASGKTIEAPEETRREDNVIDLMEALKGSLDRHSKKKATKRPTRKKATEGRLKHYRRTVTDDEIKLLDGLARKLEDLTERVAGMEIVLGEVAKSHGKPELTTARLRIRCNLLKMKGTPSAYLDAFLDSLE